MNILVYTKIGSDKVVLGFFHDTDSIIEDVAQKLEEKQLDQHRKHTYMLLQGQKYRLFADKEG